jgi:hypothetical protein
MAAAGVDRLRDSLARAEADRDEAILDAFAAKVPAADIAERARFKGVKRVYQIRDDARKRHGSAPTKCDHCPAPAGADRLEHSLRCPHRAAPVA